MCPRVHVSLSFLFLVFPEQVGHPVPEVEEGEGDGEENPGYDVYPLGTRWEPLEPPGSAQVESFALFDHFWHVDFALSHLRRHGHGVEVGRLNEGLLKEMLHQTGIRRRRPDNDYTTAAFLKQLNTLSDDLKS